jgi:hypothetical protein
VDEGNTGPAAKTAIKVSVVERIITHDEKLGIAITSSIYAKILIPKIANGETGMVLLDTQNTPDRLSTYRWA